MAFAIAGDIFRIDAQTNASKYSNMPIPQGQSTNQTSDLEDVYIRKRFGGTKTRIERRIRSTVHTRELDLKYQTTHQS